MIPFRSLIAGLIILSGSPGSAAAGDRATVDRDTVDRDTVAAVAPGGPGVLTKCRHWLVATSCRTYHHINLPSRIAVGDTITLSFGSRPKEFGFSVARIAFKGHHCAIFSKAQGNRHQMDKINVAPCYPADGALSPLPSPP